MHNNKCRIYCISIKVVALEIGYNIETAQNLTHSISIVMTIKYNTKTRELIIKNGLSITGLNILSI